MAIPSYVSGVSEKPLIGETIGQHFDAICAANPTRPALISRHQNISWTYAELQTRVNHLAAGLHDLGLVAGDRLGVWAPNCWEWIVSQYATAKIGVILVNINPAYRRAEIEYALNKVGCKALITTPRFKTSDYLTMLRDLAPELETATPGELIADRLPTLRMLITLGDEAPPGCIRFADILEKGRKVDESILAHIGADLQFDDPINIQFTSGTTGAPKGATLTHHNILNNGFFVGEAIKLQSRDKVCAPVPLYHCFGMVMANLACLTHAACVVYPSEAFDPLAVLQTVETEKCTTLYGVPTMFITILGHADFKNFNLSTLRTGIMAGSACPIEVMKQVVGQMHMRDVTIAYGMTETSPVSFQSSTDEPLDRRVATVGRIQPHLEAKIIDNSGKIVPRGMKGEICTRGYSVMHGYWNDPERTADVLDAAGWMHTGDLGIIDDEGYCNIVGRIKDVVIRGGENIYPREIEEFLYKHPEIQDVQIFGVPDLKYGEELCAWIIPKQDAKLDEDTIRAFCNGAIAHYKIPKYIKFVDGFPMTVTGKIQKFIMREDMISSHGLIIQKTA